MKESASNTAKACGLKSLNALSDHCGITPAQLINIFNKDRERFEELCRTAIDSKINRVFGRGHCRHCGAVMGMDGRALLSDPAKVTKIV